MLSKTFASTTRQMLTRPSNLVTMAARGAYTAETKPYVFINEHTKVLCQGMTGKHGTFHTEQSIAYGTKVVGGIN